MAVALNVDPMLARPPRKRWTRTECELLDAASFFYHYRCELVDGTLISKSNNSEPHLLMLAALVAWFGERFPSRGMVGSPLESSCYGDLISPPQPDLMVTKQPMDFGRTGWPQPEDVDILIEVAEADRLAFDTTVKAKLYARGGVGDYWVIDVTANRVIVHREPQAEEYRIVRSYDETDAIYPLAATNLLFRLSDIPR